MFFSTNLDDEWLFGYSTERVLLCNKDGHKQEIILQVKAVSISHRTSVYISAFLRAIVLRSLVEDDLRETAIDPIGVNASQ